MARGPRYDEVESANKPQFGVEMTRASHDREPEILAMLEKQDVMIHKLDDVFGMLYNKLDAVRTPPVPQDPSAGDEGGRPNHLSPIAERLYHHNGRLDTLIMAIQKTVDSVQL